MKKALLFSSLLLLGLTSLFAQSSKEPIVIDNTFLGHTFYHGDWEIRNVSKMKAIVANDPMALEVVKKAVVPELAYYVFGYSGGFLVGWQIGNLFFNKFNPYAFAGGLGAVVVGLGFSALADSYLYKGATIYNDNLGSTAYSNPIRLDFGLVPGGVGLTLSF